MFTNSDIPGVFKKGDWWAEIVHVRLRKVHNYGDAYSAIASMTITDGELHVEGLISIEDFSAEDVKTMSEICMDFGFTSYITSTFVKGKRVKKRNKLSRAA